MTSIADPKSDLPNEELVAYLDGELSPEECRRIEERLAQDEDYREQLRDLDQTWEVLDALPAATVDDNFGRTTIEMVAVAAEEDLSQRAAQRAANNRSTFWLWAISGAAATIAVFALGRTVLPDANDRLLADLPVIRQFDLLSQSEDIEFVRGLPTVVPIEQLADDQAAVEKEFSEVSAAAAPSLDARRRWVESLSPEDKASLTSQAKRFNELAQRNQQEQHRLRQLEQEISRDKNAEQLRKTMVIYSRWLARRSPGDQEDLRVLSNEDRIKAVAAIVRREGEEAARHLTAKDAAELREEIFEIYDERKWDFRKAMRRRDHDNRAQLEGPRRRQALMVLAWELRNDDRDDRTRERLIKQLSPEAREYWEKASRRGTERRRHQLWQWIREAMQPRWDPDDLEKFFTEELDTNQREHLLSLPADEMQVQLERLYLATELGLGHGEDWLPDLAEGERFPPNPPQRNRPDSRRPDGPRTRHEDVPAEETRPSQGPDKPPPAND